MTSAEKYGIMKFDEQRYSQMIVDFILNNPGCTAEYILKNESKKTEYKREIGRKRLFTILKKLKLKKVIIEKKSHTKARNKMLYVNEDNPLYTVSKELREFERLYPNLLEKVKGKPYPNPKLIYDTTLLLFDTMRLYMLRLVMIWSRTIEDKYTKELLNFTIFSKLYQMQIKISETLDDGILGRENAFISSVVTELYEIGERIGGALSNWNDDEIKKEMELISNFAFNIILTELARLRIYSQSLTYKWKIDPNEAEELAKGMEEDFNTRSYIYDKEDTILSMEFDQMRGK
jgi:hypothetical protein